MTRFKQALIALLLAVSLALTAVEAYAAPSLCVYFSCSGGPDNCMTIRVGTAFADVSVTCYKRLPVVQK